MSWRTLERWRRGTLAACAVSTLALAAGLWSSPGDPQREISLAELFPWLWSAAAATYATALVVALAMPAATARNGIRLASIIALFGHGIVAAAAAGRAVAWATQFGWVDSLSVWGVWAVMLSISSSAITLTIRLMSHHGDD